MCRVSHLELNCFFISGGFPGTLRSIQIQTAFILSVSWTTMVAWTLKGRIRPTSSSGSGAGDIWPSCHPMSSRLTRRMQEYVRAATLLNPHSSLSAHRFSGRSALVHPSTKRATPFKSSARSPPMLLCRGCNFTVNAPTIHLILVPSRHASVPEYTIKPRLLQAKRLIDEV